MLRSLVGSEMCIRDSMYTMYYFFVFLSVSSFLLRSSFFSSSHSPDQSTSHRTACQQYYHLTHTPSAAFLLLVRPRTRRFLSPSILAFLLLSGDIELNPGPDSFTLCTLNIRSVLHPLHSAALSDLIDSHNPDLFCLSETWIKPSTTSVELLHCTPPNYSLLSFPRNHSGTNPPNGGGTGFLIREPLTQLPSCLLYTSPSPRDS